MSALLTTTLPHMGETIAALKDAGLRDSVKVMVGGAPVTQAWADELGADGYGANAGMAVERAKGLVGLEQLGLGRLDEPPELGAHVAGQRSGRVGGEDLARPLLAFSSAPRLPSPSQAS